jgi:hypothetical protein
MTIYVCTKCGKFFNSDTLQQCPFCSEPVKMPKYDRKIWKETVAFPIDCAKFLDRDAQALHISDRNSIWVGNENPQATLRWIYYPEGDKMQVCLAITGKFHKERIAYNAKDAREWKERMWIFLPSEVLPKIIAFLQKDPDKLESWMM